MIFVQLNVSFFPLLATMNLWYALPLIVSVSLVCAATRHEELSVILQHAMRFGLWIIVFMGVELMLNAASLAFLGPHTSSSIESPL